MKKSVRWDVVVFGGASFNFTARGGSLPSPTEIARADSFETAPGGKGVIQAVAAARLGARVAFVGRVGKDARGDEIIETLKAEGVGVEFLARDGREPTGVSVVMLGGKGEKLVMSSAGANGRVSEKEVDEARPAIESTKVVLTQLELSDEPVLRAARLSKAAGALFLLDPAPTGTLPGGLLALCDLIKADIEEAYALTGIRCEDEVSAAEAARRLVLRGARAACVQADRLGRFLVSPAGEHWLHPLGPSADPGAADDAFMGALAVALSEGQRWDEAGRFASSAAALETTPTPTSTGMPRRALVLRLLAERYSAFSGR